jgi:hypothetical protein
MILCDQRADRVASVFKTESGASYLKCHAHDTPRLGIEVLAIQIWSDRHAVQSIAAM